MSLGGCPKGSDCLYDYGYCDGTLCLENDYREQLEWEALEAEELLEETEEAICAAKG